MGQRIQVKFGKRVRQLRLEAGLTQEDLSERCGLFRTYMSRIETGAANPTLTMVQALAVSLKVPIAALFEPAGPATPIRDQVPAKRAKGKG